MHPSYKSDPELGKKVHEHLVSIGLETPMTEKVNISMDSKISIIKEPKIVKIIRVVNPKIARFLSFNLIAIM